MVYMQYYKRQSYHIPAALKVEKVQPVNSNVTIHIKYMTKYSFTGSKSRYNMTGFCGMRINSHALYNMY